MDIFYSVVVFSFIGGILCLCLTYVVWTGTGLLIALNANLTTEGVQQLPAISTLLTNSQTFSLFFPTLAVLCTIVLIMSTFILSFFLKAHPLAAVLGIFSLFGYTIVSFFVSNVLIGVARLQVFSAIIGSSNYLLLFWINMPTILVVCSIVDIGIALTAARS